MFRVFFILVQLLQWHGVWSPLGHVFAQALVKIKWRLIEERSYSAGAGQGRVYLMVQAAGGLYK